MFGDRSSERVFRHLVAMAHVFDLDSMDDDADMFMSPAPDAQHAYPDQVEDRMYDSPHSHFASDRNESSPRDHATANLPTARSTQDPSRS